MDIRYNGEHSITFIDYNESTSTIVSIKRTWTDFHLIPEKRPSVVFKKPSYSLVDIPGTSKTVDITSYMLGGQTYTMRTGSWTFYINHEQWSSWIQCKRELESFFNGKALYCIIDDEYGTLYKGRFKIDSFQTGSTMSKVSIGYELFNDDLEYELQSKSVSPLPYWQTIVPDNGYYGLSKVVIEPIPENYVDTTGDDGRSYYVLSGINFLTNISGYGIEDVGTMPNVGTFNGTIDCLTNESCSIPQGFIAGGTITVDTADLEDELASI